MRGKRSPKVLVIVGLVGGLCVGRVACGIVAELNDRLAASSWFSSISDIDELIQALGYQSAILMAHDWGGIVAWDVAYRFPERIDRLIIFNSPNPRYGLSNCGRGRGGGRTGARFLF